ncbi:O-antigen ligase family protein [Bacillus cereus]|uniref:O-antigen ligase family protein n=1 Tax=Bacillus cereus group TaxID=86661 RepID=UPI0008FE0929|nr:MULTISPECIES: O-antigen ligase family protein [Bacillus cereus group]AXO95508.1 O-antigen ligase family protein [Bacillus anthracis]MBE3645899.1 O-antigen ligase family protein [Bacillus anthracis]MDA2122886.1 O-antigen ligase family protein [Bacillus cereus]MDD0820119.1 O-antigen ligase family protein [Bacillus cereus]OJD87219.1 polymerase [Bacillus anthracis]
MIQLNRFHYITLSIFLIIVGLIFSATYTGLFISALLAITAFRDEKLGLAYLLLFIPMRPFLAAYNTGFKFIGIFIILALLCKLLLQYKHNISKLFSFHYFEIAYFLFCLFGSIVGLINGVSIIAVIMQLHTLLLFYIVFYVVSRLFFHHDDFLFFAKITFIASVIISIHGLIEKLSLRSMLLPEAWKALVLAPTNKIRIYGMAGGPNELALYLTLAFLISLYLLQNASVLMKYIVYIGLTLIATTLWLTYSRGAFLTILIFAFLYIIIQRSIPYWKTLLIVTLTSFLCATGISLMTNYFEGDSLGTKRFSEALSEETVELSKQDGRIYYVKKALEIFQDKPITGYGFGTFGDAATQTYSSPIYKIYNITWNFYSDNQYIQLLAETGILGTILILIFTLGMFSIMWPFTKEHALSPLILYLMVGAIIGSAFYNILENNTFMLYLYLTVGYLYSRKTQKNY